MVNPVGGDPLFSLAGRKALVTGGRRGLGRAMVEGFLERGVSVVSVAKSPPPDDLIQFAVDHGAALHSLELDLSDAAAREGLCARAASLLGGLDILINNAGLQVKAALEGYTVEMFRDDYALMVEAPYDLSRQAAAIMSEGCILNVSSISGFQGARNIVGYSTAKHAVVGLTKCLANELAARGIRVNCIAPGLFETDMAAATTQDPIKRGEMLGRIPAGRFGEPRDIVGPVVFLCSEAGRHVHGATILVDGGWMGR